MACVNIEICINSASGLTVSKIIRRVEKYLSETGIIKTGSVLKGDILPRDVNFVRICEVDDSAFNVKMITTNSPNIKIRYHVFVMCDSGPEMEYLNHDDDNVPSCDHWILPNREFEGLWENLIYDDEIKDKLIRFVLTSLLFSTHDVSSQVISWNSVVLLHGPPGTGKTSLCKALAHKIAIRLSQKYAHCQLIEINTHSLFSKWFSESGKLVTKMFNEIKGWLSSGNFVCILIDEVESLAHARKLAMSGTDPSDAVRVVNALLTQLDLIKRFPNVLILSTSNMVEAIDVAFADRADIKHFIGHPSVWAIYHILKSTIDELALKRLLVEDCAVFDAKTIKMLVNSGAEPSSHNDPMADLSELLLNLSTLCSGFSGRTLRKIPKLAYAEFTEESAPTATQFIQSMKVIAGQIRSDNSYFN